MTRNYTALTPVEVVDVLNELIRLNGSVKVVVILPPGTPVSEVALAKTQSVTRGYTVKVDL